MDEHLSHITVQQLASAQSVMTPATWRQQGLNRPYGRIFYIKSGTGFIRSFGREHALEPGRVYLIPPRGDLAYGCHGELETWWMLFKASLYGSVDLFDYLDFHNVLIPTDRPELEQRMLRLLTTASSNHAADRIEATGILMQLIAPFFRVSEHPQEITRQDGRRRFLPVLRHIDEHLGQHLTLRDLARIAGLQESYFATQFSQAFGLPPMKYLNRRRIERVQFVLQRSGAKLEQLAGEFGFRDAFHLSKAFKRETGQSPRHYRLFLSEGETGPDSSSP